MINRFRAIIFAVTMMIWGAATAQQPTKTIGGNNFIVHKVSSGETLYKLSKKYNVSVADIKAANGNSDQIKIGQELLIPSGTAATVSNTSAVSSEHTVVSGETLSKIAKDNGVTVDDIKSWNGLKSNDIRIGQKLIIKSSGVTTKPAAIVVDDKPVVEKPVVEKTVVQTKPVETKSTVEKNTTKAPDNPRNTSDKITVGKGSQIEKGAQTGIPESTEIVLAETATEKEEIANARIMDVGMDQTRTFVKHPTLPKGSIVVVINESTGKMAYCRVVDNIKLSDLNGSTLAMTKAVADKIGIKGASGDVKIKYAAP